MTYNQALDTESDAKVALELLHDLVSLYVQEDSATASVIRSNLERIRDRARKELDDFDAEDKWWDAKQSEMAGFEPF